MKIISVACGKLLQTPEERIAIIEKLQSKQKFNVKRFLKDTLIITILGVLYFIYYWYIIHA